MADGSPAHIPPVRFGWRLRIGMLLPSANTVAEDEVTAMLADGVSLHTTRLKLTSSEPEALLRMADGAETGAELLADAQVDLIVFHCTAVSTYDIELERSIKARIEKASGIAATTTAEALIAALRALKADRTVLVTPYPREVNEREMAFLAQHRIAVLRETSLRPAAGAGFAGIEPGAWYRHAKGARHADAEAYLLSCTAIRTAAAIAPLERDLGKPVITSNQALAWHAMRSGGIRDSIAGFGALLEHR